MIKRAFYSYLVAALETALLLFFPAGTLHYWQGWVFMGEFLIPMLLIMLYLFRYSPELLKRRLEVKEKKPGQSILSRLFYSSIGLIFLISGLDRRYGWSSVPTGLVIAAEIIFLCGYFFLFLVFRENKYLAHTVKVDKEQRVIRTGPYAFLRHPMYFAELTMFLFAPLALGSYWGILGDALMLPALVIRIITEEKTLLSELHGYREYTLGTKYRLIPLVW